MIVRTADKATTAAGAAANEKMINDFRWSLTSIDFVTFRLSRGRCDDEITKLLTSRF